MLDFCWDYVVRLCVHHSWAYYQCLYISSPVRKIINSTRVLYNSILLTEYIKYKKLEPIRTNIVCKHLKEDKSFFSFLKKKRKKDLYIHILLICTNIFLIIPNGYAYIVERE